MKKNNMRLVSIVMGEDTKEHRTNETVSLLEYGYSMYGVSTIYDKEKFSNKMFVSNSSLKYIDYYLKDDVKLVLNKDDRDAKYETQIKLNDVKAPLEAGSKVGEMILKINGEILKYDLIVKEYVKKANYFEVFGHLLKDVINGKVNVF